MEEILKVKLPYPTLESPKKNLRVATLISNAYAGGHGELRAILQYAYQYIYFKAQGDNQTAKIVMGIAICEMEHLRILGEVILALGGDPIYATPLPFGCSYFSTSKVWYGKTPEKMLIDDVSGEITAISEYEKMIEIIEDEGVRAILERIVLDERLHQTVLKERLNEIGKGGFNGLNLD